MDRDDALLLLDSCMFRIRRVQSSRRAARMHANLSGDWLSPTALAIMSELEESGPTRVKVLADRIQADLSRASRQVHDLAERGYVDLVADERDGRVVMVELTKLGVKQWNTYHDEVRRVLAANLAEWSDADIARFAKMFDRFLLTLGPSPEDVQNAAATTAKKASSTARANPRSPRRKK